MSNADIIFTHSMELANAGKIRFTDTVIGSREDGTPVFLPEAIHTFAAWKSRGFSVKKGEHAVAKFAVWKYKNARTVEVEQEDGTVTEETRAARMFLQSAAFFSASQVERITA